MQYAVGMDTSNHAVAALETAVVAAAAAAEESLFPLADQATAAIDRVFDGGHPIACAYSSGKDSSVVVNLVLNAAARRVRAGLPVPKILVIHSDTKVENPEVRALADAELEKIEAFARRNGFDLEARIGTPLLYVSWAVRVIGGRALPSFANSSRDCSFEWKAAVGERLQSEVFAELREIPGAAMPVLMTGVRREESVVRAASIAKRGEQGDRIWSDDKGRLRLSPIVEWGVDDVWEYLGYCSAGMIESYSDFQETMRFYRDAGGSSCAVVADMKMAEVAKMKGGCGARSGCWTCVRVSKDKSLEQMIQGDLERYGYMAGLNRLRDFIANTQFDWDRRTFLGRTIDDDGNVAIKADVYSPAMLEELLRYTLTLQCKEQLVAQRKGIEPRFNIIGYRELIGIDAVWSLYGLHKPFHALKIMWEVRRGAFAEIPRVDPPARTSPPNYGKLHVGRSWEEDRLTGDPWRDRIMDGGIRSPIEEMFSESCGHGIRENSRGDLVTAWDTSMMFEVDEEGAGDFVELMSEEYIAQHHKDQADRTKAVMTYLAMGFLTPAHGSLMRWHEIARRTQWMQRHGLVGDVQRERLRAMMDMQHRGIDPFSAPEQEAASADHGPEPVPELQLQQQVQSAPAAAKAGEQMAFDFLEAV